jgi:hypothetical protein
MFVPILLLVFMERSRGLRISGIQFGVFSFLFCTSLLPFYSRIKQLAGLGEREDEKGFPAATFIVSFVFIFVSFVCHFFVEKAPAYSGPNAPEDTPMPCPEILASIPSKLLFSWFTGFAWTGVKRTLVATDLWDLSPTIRSKNIVARFNRHWEKLSNSVNFVKSSSRLNNASFNKNGENVEIKSGKKSEAAKYQVRLLSHHDVTLHD